MKIREKLLITPALILTLFAISALFIFQSFQNISHATAALENASRENHDVHEMLIGLEVVRRSTGEIILGEDRFQDFSSAWLQVNKYYESHSLMYESLETAEQEILASLGPQLTALEAQSSEIVLLTRAGKLSEAREAFETADQDFIHASRLLIDVLHLVEEKLVAAQLLTLTEQKNAILIIILTVLSTILAGFTLAFFSAKSISERLILMEEGVENILKGRMNERLQVLADDEVADLAKTFNAMFAKLQESYTALEGDVEQRTKELTAIKQKLELSVDDTTRELKKKLTELERTNKVMIGRETKMVELKKENELLKKQLREA